MVIGYWNSSLYPFYDGDASTWNPADASYSSDRGDGLPPASEYGSRGWTVDAIVTFEAEQVTEPGTLVMVLIGLGGVAARMRRRRFWSSEDPIGVSHLSPAAPPAAGLCISSRVRATSLPVPVRICSRRLKGQPDRTRKNRRVSSNRCRGRLP